MEWVHDRFLSAFWFLGGIAALVNLFVYRRVFDESCSDTIVARQAYRDFRKVMLWVAVGAVALGVIQAAGGFSSPIFPFELPSSEWNAVTLSWVVVLSGLAGLMVFLNSRSRPTAHLLARVMLARAVDGRVALVIVNAVLALTIFVLAVVLVFAQLR